MTVVRSGPLDLGANQQGCDVERLEIDRKRIDESLESKIRRIKRGED